MIIQVVLQLFLKGSIDDIWGLFLIMQLIAYMSVYDINIPGNVEIYVEEFRKLVAFEVLKPDQIMKILDDDAHVKLLLIKYGLASSNDVTYEMPASLESSGQSASFVVNVAQYIVAFVFFIILVLLLKILVKSRFFKVKVKKFLINLKKNTFFKNTIRSVTLSYLDTCI